MFENQENIHIHWVRNICLSSQLRLSKLYFDGHGDRQIDNRHGH